MGCGDEHEDQQRDGATDGGDRGQVKPQRQHQAGGGREQQPHGGPAAQPSIKERRELAGGCQAFAQPGRRVQASVGRAGGGE
jgi:hypothetical protein